MTADFVHPSQMTDVQRREATASVFDRFARAHELAASRGIDAKAQRQSATNARHAARRIREAGR